MTSAEALRIARENAVEWSDEPDDLHRLARWVVSVLGEQPGLDMGWLLVTLASEMGDPEIIIRDNIGRPVTGVSAEEARAMAAILLRAADQAEGKADE